MRIPRFWQKAEQQATTAQGHTWQISAWGWSDESEQQAAEAAQERLRAQAAAIAAGKPHERYLYHDRPMREEILERPSEGSVITRNGYGARILNTERAAFVDVDLELPAEGARPKGFFARLFGGGERTREQVLDEQLGLLRAALRGADASARVYETHSGLRLLLIDRARTPGAADTQALQESLGSDPLYRTLCREQECFRARLTPKPWRCGLSVMPYRWPYEGDEQARAAKAWIDRYEAASSSYAAARFLTTLGPGTVDAEVRPVVELHDRLSKSESGLPLA